MLLVLRNYQSVVDANGWVIDGADKVTLQQETKNAVYMAKDKVSINHPNSVANHFKMVVGVTFDEADQAVESIYGSKWNNCVKYGDMILVASRLEFLRMPDNSLFYLALRNDRDNYLGIVFDFKKYMIHDPNRKSHQKGKCLLNYCNANTPPSHRDENTLTLISLMKNDEALLEDDVLMTITTDPMFSSII